MKKRRKNTAEQDIMKLAGAYLPSLKESLREGKGITWWLNETLSRLEEIMKLPGACPMELKEDRMEQKEIMLPQELLKTNNN